MWFRTDCVEGNEGLYKNITDLVRQFEGVGANIDTNYERESNLHQHFAENLFRSDAEDVNLNHRSDTEVQINILKPANMVRRGRTDWRTWYRSMYRVATAN